MALSQEQHTLWGNMFKFWTGSLTIDLVNTVRLVVHHCRRYAATVRDGALQNIDITAFTS